jgi:hypothetical protein
METRFLPTFSPAAPQYYLLWHNRIPIAKNIAFGGHLGVPMRKISSQARMFSCRKPKFRAIAFALPPPKSRKTLCDFFTQGKFMAPPHRQPATPLPLALGSSVGTRVPAPAVQRPVLAHAEGGIDVQPARPVCMYSQSATLQLIHHLHLELLLGHLGISRPRHRLHGHLLGRRDDLHRR